MTFIKKHQCEKCLNWFSTRGGNFKRHAFACNGDYTPPQGNIRQCRHCKEKFDISDKPKGWMANHSRWCAKNPKRKEYTNGSLNAIAAMNRARKKSGRTNQFTVAKLDGKEVPAGTMKGKQGTFLGKSHTEQTKQKIREKALASPHRRLKKGTIEYKGILLDSSWELELAKRLDKLGIKWTRPDPIPWIDNEGITHNYFPDFYLEDYNLFLDPKNPHAAKVQKIKIDCILSQYDNIIILKSIEECKNFSL